jgi:hypothetical protein
LIAGNEVVDGAVFDVVVVDTEGGVGGVVTLITSPKGVGGGTECGEVLLFEPGGP